MSVYFITCGIYVKGRFCNKVLMQFAYKDKVKCIEVAKDLIKQDIETDGFKQVSEFKVEKTTEKDEIQYIYEIIELPVYE